MCNIAQSLEVGCRMSVRHGEAAWSPELTEASNLDQLFSRDWAIMMSETSTSSRSFRSSELSQPI